MKKTVISVLVFFLAACQSVASEAPVESDRLSLDELATRLEGSNADAFYGEVSTVYSLFPIAFADSDNDNLGDLNGVINQLDYLNDGKAETKTDLGIDAVWFNPIHPSPTYHKYDVKDYKAIDPEFGTLEDFKTLVAEAHKRGIKIILDMVFNHTSSEHPWFKKALLGEAPYTDYYHIFKKVDFTQYPSKEGWQLKNGLTYYGGFWSEMPDLNADNEAVRDELKSVLDFWIDLGVDGFRFDAASHVYDPNEYPKGTQLLQANKQFWMEMKDYVKTKDPETFLIAEVWMSAQNAAPYAMAFDALFNFDLATAIVTAVKNGYQNNLVSAYQNGIRQDLAKNPEYLDAIFLSNHDQDRVMSQLGSDVEKGKLAATILFSLPGLPFVYYGEELGMTGQKPDEKIREPFVWDGTKEVPTADWEGWTYNAKTASYQTQVKDPASIWNLYRDLIAFRKEHSVLKRGSIENVDLGTNRLLAFTRSDATETLMVVHNLSKDAQEVTLTQNTELVFNQRENTLKDKALHLEPYGSVILQVKER